jgi:hypothetical protein
MRLHEMWLVERRTFCENLFRSFYAYSGLDVIELKNASPYLLLVASSAAIR